MTFLVVSTILLWALVLVLTALVILLYRQFGLMYLGSGGRVRLHGVRVGDRAPAGAEVQVGSDSIVLDWSAPGPGRGTLLLFGIPRCPACEAVLPELNSIVDDWGHMLDVAFVDRATEQVVRALPPDRRWLYATSQDGALHKLFDVDVSLYVYIIDHAGMVRARELVDSVETIQGFVSQSIGPDGSFVDRVDPADQALEGETSSLSFAPTRER